MGPRAESVLDEAIPITGIEYDSRRVEPGNLFVCIRGLLQDGHEFAGKAIERGAVLALGDRESIDGVERYVRVREARSALALLSCAFFDHPSRSLVLTGVTGTNGKTSVTWLCDAIHREAGWTSAVMGTLGSGSPDRPGEFRPALHTTPEAPELQSELASFRDAGVAAAAMEVSSHALALRRSYGTRFSCVVFTNLSPEHLDFHGTMDGYRESKALLFHPETRGPDEPPAIAVVNADDPATEALMRGSRDSVLSFGRGAGAQVKLLDARMDPDGIRMTIAWDTITFPHTQRPHAGRSHRVGAFRLPGGEVEVASPLLGSFQVDNILAAFSAGLALGIDPVLAARGAGRLRRVPGRMERVDRGQPFRVVVDYAHTPDALDRALTSLRPFTPGRLWVVFGCGGDRDSGKRPLMGHAAFRRADAVILTDDNPRMEDPALIRAQVRAGFPQAGAHVLLEEGDREQAIRAALIRARPGDTVLIAGKGHETAQIRGGASVPFDDREVAGHILEELRS